MTQLAFEAVVFILWCTSASSQRHRPLSTNTFSKWPHCVLLLRPLYGLMFDCPFNASGRACLNQPHGVRALFITLTLISTANTQKGASLVTFISPMNTAPRAPNVCVYYCFSICILVGVHVSFCESGLLGILQEENRST